MSKYYAVFDESGKIAGFYCDAVHGENIPAGALEISESDWQLFITDPAMFKLDNNVVRQKTPQEIEEELASRPPRPPSHEERLAALEQALLELLEVL